MNCFKQASYLGITATPFANIFIDPEDETDEAARDLFPKDFLTVLPTPENYIGADRIFGNGNADEWDNESDGNRNLGEFNDALIPIENEEQDSFFYFKHKKEIAYELTDIPASMKEAIRYFILSSAISDYRRDYTEHRSMLVNVSRFTLVQNQTADIIESFLNRIKLDLENYAQLPAIESMKINSISMLFDVWNKYNLDKVIDIDWEEFLQKYLYKATRRIEVRSVNQSSGASALDYHNYKDIGMRVIAVGGFLLADSEHPIEFHLGYDNGQRCFIVMNSGKVDDIVSSKAITAKNVITGNTKSLLFLLRYESLEDIFSNLCWDLITYTKQSDNPIKDLIDRFNNWQKLLQKLPNGLMSANAQKGLIGELLYLEYLIDQNGVKHAFESWVGPDGSDQDFLLDDSWTEVKTTTISSDSINISSLEQLDRDDFGRLVVYFMDKVDSPNKSTITLGDIFERVFAKLTDSQYIDSLICKTSKVGFDIKNVEKYKTIHFKLVGSSCYAVRDEFPRLTKKNIPNGIISAGYSISLSSINNYRIEEK